jgi:hypothetical protein
MKHAIQAAREFYRFFPRHVAAIGDRCLGTEVKPAEVGLLFEIVDRKPVLAHLPTEREKR